MMMFASGWTKRATHTDTIGLFVQFVVTRKDGFRTCIANKFAKRGFLKLRFDKLLAVDSIFNDS